jgi:hypothetical protein
MSSYFYDEEDHYEDDEPEFESPDEEVAALKARLAELENEMAGTEDTESAEDTAPEEQGGDDPQALAEEIRRRDSEWAQRIRQAQSPEEVYAVIDEGNALVERMNNPKPAGVSDEQVRQQLNAAQSPEEVMAIVRAAGYPVVE